MKLKINKEINGHRQWHIQGVVIHQGQEDLGN